MNKILPENFDWKFYLEYYEDLRFAGLKTEEDVINHYLNHGVKEGRIFKEISISKKENFKNSSVFICGTSPEIEILNDKELVKKIENNYKVLCINSSFHYFDRIDCVFFNSRFKILKDSDFSNKIIDEIYIPQQIFIKNYKIVNFCVNSIKNVYFDEIKTKLDGCLPHGPTTLLDIVFPFCVYNEVKNIFILGAEYNQNLDVRHSQDSTYVERKTYGMDRNLEINFAKKKLLIWKNYFEKNNINCYALSDKSETPFEKINLNKFLECKGLNHIFNPN
jgi:hypothetical protein